MTKYRDAVARIAEIVKRQSSYMDEFCDARTSEFRRMYIQGEVARLETDKQMILAGTREGNEPLNQMFVKELQAKGFWKIMHH